LSAQEYGPEATDVASRAHYWAKLQELWFVRDSWQEEYGVDFQVFRKWFEITGNWIEVQARRFFG